MGFNWKDLFVVNENKDAEVPVTSTNQPVVSMPSTVPQAAATPKSTFNSNSVANADLLEVYEKGFAGLNKEGYDFFEMYQAIMTVGNHNADTYKMALAMGKAIKPDLSSDFLVQKGQEYIREIEKVHQGYAQTGAQKHAQIAKQMQTEKANLELSVVNLEQQLAKIQSNLQEQKKQLANVNDSFAPAMAEIEAKILANDSAKDKLLQSINQVLTGIKQHL